MLWNTQVRLQNYAIYREEPLPTLLVVQSYFYCLTQINISLFWLLLVCCCLEGLLERTDKTGAGLAPPCFYSRCGKVQAAVIQTNPINWRQCTAMQGSTKHLGRIKLPFLMQKELIFLDKRAMFWIGWRASGDKWTTGAPGPMSNS